MKNLFTMGLFITLSLTASIWAATYTTSTEYFTDTQGQRTKFRIGIPDNYTPGTEAKVLIHFHGNNSGSQDRMLDMWHPQIQREADERGLIPVTMASPEYYIVQRDSVNLQGDTVTYNDTIRQWNEDKDPQLLLEFLQSDLGGFVKPDQNGVYLWGDSKGGCFLNAYLLKYPDNYGGGAFAHCGCFNGLNNGFKPGQDFIDTYRLYVLATTEDHLYDASTSGYRFYRWTAGMKNIRGDLSRPGGHCSSPASTADSALSWLLGDLEIPETPDELHWQRVSTLDSIQSLDIDSRNRIIAAIKSENDHRVIVSENQGDSWETLINLGNETIRSAWGGKDGDILVLTDSKFYRFNAVGLEQDQESVDFLHLREDGDGNLFRLGNSNMEISLDGGKTWLSTGLPDYDVSSAGQSFVDSSTSEISVKTGYNTYSIISSDASESIISMPGDFYYDNLERQNGVLLATGADPNNGWAPKAWTSTNNGLTWTPVTLHFTHGGYYSNFSLSLYHDGRILFQGWDAYLSADNGATWVEEVNLSFERKVIGTLDAENIAYMSDGIGIFRRQAWTNESERPQHTNGDYLTSTLNQTLANLKLKVQRYGQVLILQNDVQTQIDIIQADGSSQRLYNANPEGKTAVQIGELPLGSILVVQDTRGQRTVIK